jgi:hypothetical protein
MSDQASSGDALGSTELKAGHAPASKNNFILFDQNKRFFFFEIVKVGGMRVGASRPRQTSQGDDKNKNISSEETTEDNATASGKDGQTGNNNQNSEESADDG